MSIQIKSYSYIIIHHSESSFSAKVSDLKAGCLHWLSPEAKRRLTDQNYEADYHKFIRDDGTVEMGQPLKYWTANCGIDEINENSLAICCIGSLQSYQMPEKMLSSLINEVKYWMKLYKIPHEKVMLHRDIVSTSCPGDNFPEKRFMEAIMDSIFKDMTGKEWSYSAIYSLANHGIVTGDKDGRFRPREELTREEASQMIYNALHWLGKL